MTRTGFIYHEKMSWHAPGTQWMLPAGAAQLQPLIHPESSESKRRFKNLVDASKLSGELTFTRPKPATRNQIDLVHTPSYVDRIEQLSNGLGGDAGEDCPIGRASYEYALLSAGAAICAVDAVLNKELSNAYALTRPPGHHALPDRGYGFCVFNNISIATQIAIRNHSLQRIAIVDWDVHHGNGTEAIFYEDNRVLTISMHQDRLFPEETGQLGNIGIAAGEGCNLNIPLPAGSGHAAFVAAFRRVVVTALNRYQPELIVVASGLDANQFDPLGRMMATSETYRSMTRMVMDAADRLCDGRLVLCTKEVIPRPNSRFEGWRYWKN